MRLAERAGYAKALPLLLFTRKLYGKYVIKRILLLFFTLFVIMTICFVLIKLLEPNEILDVTQAEREEAIRDALGYNEPILIQYLIYWKNILTRFDFGVSFQIEYLGSVNGIIQDRLLPTILINVYALLFSVPLGILLGIAAALKKNRWQDHTLPPSSCCSSPSPASCTPSCCNTSRGEAGLAAHPDGIRRRDGRLLHLENVRQHDPARSGSELRLHRLAGALHAGGARREPDQRIHAARARQRAHERTGDAAPRAEKRGWCPSCPASSPCSRTSFPAR